MLAPWVIDEMKTAKLGDKRLNARLAKCCRNWRRDRPRAFLQRAADAPRWLPLTGFARVRNTSFDSVLQPHVDATRQRMATQSVVVLRKTPRKLTRLDQNNKWWAPVRWTAILVAARCST